MSAAPPGPARDVTLLSTEYYRSLRDARVRAAQSCAARAFFLRLEAGSDERFFGDGREMGGGARALRADAVRHLVTALNRRLEDRWRSRCPVKLTRVREEAVREISALFIRSLGDLVADPVHAGGMFEAFAAGTLRHEVTFEHGGRSFRVPVCEPDSYFVFMFAEFALVAIERDVDAALWRSLLPALVRMQALYVARAGGRRRVTACTGSMPVLSSMQRRSALERFRGIDINEVSAPELIHVHLRQAGSASFA